MMTTQQLETAAKIEAEARKHLSPEDATYLAIRLATMPRERALALLDAARN